MPEVRGKDYCSHKFYNGGITTDFRLIPPAQLLKEAAFIAYYFHWNHDDIMSLPHEQRRAWCTEISSINRELSSEAGGEQIRIEDMKV
ncbi:MAG: hypothetical protein FWE74_08590 [Oscillospiraceae bacterium]|nr:hypothetical protein [Oscillospiraceae bacterium]